MLSDSQIGKNIKNLREIKNYTQYLLAENLGVSQKQISRIENGEITVTIQQLFKICKTLDIEIHVLLEFDSKKIFNNTINPSGGKEEFKNRNSNTVQEIQELYERLLNEKECTITILKNILSKKE